MRTHFETEAQGNLEMAHYPRMLKKSIMDAGWRGHLALVGKGLKVMHCLTGN